TTPFLIVKTYPDMLGEPGNDLANSKALDVEGTRTVWIQSSLHRNDRDDTLFKERHSHVLTESSSSLIDVGLYREAVVKTTVDGLEIALISVEANVLQLDSGHIDSESIVDRPNDRLASDRTRSSSVRTNLIASPIVSQGLERICLRIVERIPCMRQLVTKGHTHSLPPFLLDSGASYFL